MKAKRQIRALRCLVVAHRLDAAAQRKRIDEAMARIADLERALLEMTERVEAMEEAGASKVESVTYPDGYTITTLPDSGAVVSGSNPAWCAHTFVTTTGGTRCSKCGFEKISRFGHNAGLAASGNENHPSTGVQSVDWECGVCGRIIPAGAQHSCDGTWWYDGEAAYEVAGER